MKNWSQDVRRYAISVVLAIVVNAAAVLLGPQHSAPAWDAGLSAVEPGQDSSSPPRYELRAVHDRYGTGRFYMGREIALTMGPDGIGWLNRPQREQQEHPEEVIRAMDLHGGEVVADLGAGSGYFTFRLASQVGTRGKVLAVEIQDEMLAALRQRAAALGVTNVEEVRATETDPQLPPGGVDWVLMVDAYHELAYPYEVMTKVREALSPRGRVMFVEYRQENPRIPIMEVHKMSVRQLTREMDAVGLGHVRTVETLPSQHIVIFAKRH